MRKASLFNLAALTLGMAFLYLPIVILVIYSFNASRLVAVWGGWSIHWYAQLAGDAALLAAASSACALRSFRRAPRRCWERLPRWRSSVSAGFAGACCSPP